MNYWIVDPKNQSLEVYILEDNRYKMAFFAIENGLIQSNILANLSFDVSTILNRIVVEIGQQTPQYFTNFH